MQLAMDIGLQALEKLEIPLVQDKPVIYTKKESPRVAAPIQLVVAGRRMSTHDLMAPPKTPRGEIPPPSLKKKRSVTDLLDQTDVSNTQQMTNEATLAAMRILMTLCAPTYVLRPDLNMRVAFTMVDLTIKHGVSILGAFGYGLYALVCFLFDLDEAYYAGQMSLRLLEKCNAAHFTCKIYGLYYAHVDPWKNPLKSSMEPMLMALNSGNYYSD